MPTHKFIALQLIVSHLAVSQYQCFANLIFTKNIFILKFFHIFTIGVYITYCSQFTILFIATVSSLFPFYHTITLLVLQKYSRKFIKKSYEYIFALSKLFIAR